jgi:hypothetical protein
MSDPVQLELGQALRDEGMARVTDASGEWDRKVVDHAIRFVASQGQPFSANDVRPLLPEGLRPALLGARFRTAALHNVIRRIGYVPSTDPGTHAHPIALWVGALPVEDGAFDEALERLAEPTPERRGAA